jgi:hypothetical protein
MPPQGGADPKPAISVVPQAKPIKVVKSCDLSAKTYMESAEDVEEFVDALKSELLAVVSSGHRARIQ